MTLISWLVVFEFIVGIFLLIWLIRKAFKHAKHSPAEIALQQHLIELEAAKLKKAEDKPVAQKNSKKVKK